MTDVSALAESSPFPIINFGYLPKEEADRRAVLKGGTREGPNNHRRVHSSQGPVYAKARRLGRACVSCRTRKIRCDLVIFGAPCTNCRHSRTECVPAANKRDRSSLNRHAGGQLSAESREDENSQGYYSTLYISNSASTPLSSKGQEFVQRSLLGFAPSAQTPDSGKSPFAG